MPNRRNEPNAPVRLLLVNPRLPESFWSFRWALERVLPGKRALNPPLGLATLAALCPEEWEVEIVDENVERVPDEPRADIVGVCGMGVQFPRQRELLRRFRDAGHFVVAGGSYASLCPERYADLADSVVAGEAEHIWPEFCRDYARGAPRRLYQETGAVDLGVSPVPRFELLKLDRYLSVSLQFSRGCPYRCEFCDIVVMFGRRPRTKTPEQVTRELDRLRELGVRRVFFVDDNLIGHRAKAKALLRHLAEYQRRHDHAFQFGTEASINLAEDAELLALFREARFAWVFIGIESPDEASLVEARKTQNTRGDALEAVRRIYAHGIEVLGGFIVGFDNDTPETFDRQERFIVDSGIQVAMVGLLTALPRTPLHARLAREGRLLPEAVHADNTRAGTNFVPRGMPYETMVAGYRTLCQRLTTNASIAERICNKCAHLGHPVYRPGDSLRERAGMALRLLAFGLLPGGPARWYHFARSLVRCPPRTWPLVMSEWVSGLAMRDYARRYLRPHGPRERRIEQATLAFIQRRCADSVRRRALEVSLRRVDAGVQLAITLRGGLDRRFFTRASRRIERLLRHSAATLSLDIAALPARHGEHLAHLLRRLARYGDRVCVRVDPERLSALGVDTCEMHLIVDPA